MKPNAVELLVAAAAEIIAWRWWYGTYLRMTTFDETATTPGELNCLGEKV